VKKAALSAVALVLAAAAGAAEPWVAVHGGWQDGRPDDLKAAAAVADLPWWPQPGDGTLETAAGLGAGYRRARVDDAIVLPAGADLPGGGALPAGATLPVDLSGPGLVLGLGLSGR